MSGDRIEADHVGVSQRSPCTGTRERCGPLRAACDAECSVDNCPFPRRISGKTSTEPTESLDVVVHSKVRGNASKDWTGADRPWGSNSRPCCRSATEFRRYRQAQHTRQRPTTKL